MSKIEKKELLKLYNDLNKDTLEKLGIFKEAKQAYEEKKLLEERKKRAADEAMDLIKEGKEILKDLGLELRISRTRTKIVNEDGSTFKNIQKQYSKKRYTNLSEYYNSEKKEISIPIRSASPIQYRYIDLYKSIRHLFPGYLIPFTLKTNIGDIECKVTSAPKGAEKGDPEKGRYIKSVKSNKLSGIFDSNDIEVGDSFKIKILEPKKLYSLKIIK